MTVLRKSCGRTGRGTSTTDLFPGHQVLFHTLGRCFKQESGARRGDRQRRPARFNRPNSLGYNLVELISMHN